MASRKQNAKDTTCGRRKGHSKPTGPMVKRISKGSLPRKVKERRRSPSLSKGGKIMPASSFEDLAKKAVDQAPEYLRQRVGYPLPLKGVCF